MHNSERRAPVVALRTFPIPAEAPALDDLARRRLGQELRAMYDPSSTKRSIRASPNCFSNWKPTGAAPAAEAKARSYLNPIVSFSGYERPAAAAPFGCGRAHHAAQRRHLHL